MIDWENPPEPTGDKEKDLELIMEMAHDIIGDTTDPDTLVALAQFDRLAMQIRDRDKLAPTPESKNE